MTNITSASSGKMIMNCPHCKNELNENSTSYSMGYTWKCEQHGDIYGFYGVTLFEYENSRKLHETNKQSE